MSLQITPIPAYSDNYIWVIHDTQRAIVVDPGQADPVKTFLFENELQLSGILITHHHYDHIDGVEELLQINHGEVFAPLDKRIPFSSTIVKEGDLVQFPSLGFELNVIETPGHTLSHICYLNDQWLFCGDTLFSIGCGRMFEGTPEMYVNSLKKLRNLPGSLQVFCTHEYTLSNLAFALSLEPDNKALNQFKTEVNELRKQNKPSLPTWLHTEKSLNPFLRTNQPRIQSLINAQTKIEVNNEVSCFAGMRQLKDIF